MMNSCIIDVLPSNILLDIFSRVSVKCLARSRCVSKVWCKYIDDERLVEEPTPILYHQHLSHEKRLSLCFHVVESKQTGAKPQNLPQLCKHFNKGTCKFGDRCKFIHDHRNRAGLTSNKNNNTTPFGRTTVTPNTVSWRSASAPYHAHQAQPSAQSRAAQYQPTPTAFLTPMHYSTPAKQFVYAAQQPQHIHPSHNYVLEAKEDPFLDFYGKTPLSESSTVRIEVRGSCNGLICLSQDDGEVVTSLAVVHPLRKECYELPSLSICFDITMLRDSCGLGFDASTNTLKMVCVLCKGKRVCDPDMVQKNLCTMVHVFGTNSWREIPSVPSYPITGKAVFANGCLHWVVNHFDLQTVDGGRPVIWFNVEKEEFGLIDPPEKNFDIWRSDSWNDQVVDLNGEVGYVSYKTMECWLLNHKKEWVPHCRFPKHIVPYGFIEVLGCWNKAGDMLIKRQTNGRYEFLVYNLKYGVKHKTNIAGQYEAWSPNFIMYPNNPSSIRGIINTNSSSLEKAIVKKISCQGALSGFR